MTGVERLGANQPADRFYRGGSQIRQFRRGASSDSDRVPEDWVGSVTTLWGESSLGLSRVATGEYLRDAIAADPVAWLGPTHLERFGADPMILVKLLDAGERLPVHAHPHRDFAARHLGRSHGKAEAWFALRAGTVGVGLTRDVTLAELSDLTRDQRTVELISLLHQVEVAAGDTVYVPPGTLHAIGADNFVIEVQEPEDMSILLEWDGFAIDGAALGHLGLGFETALQAIDRTGLSIEEVERLCTRGFSGPSILPAVADQYFRLGLLRGDEPVELPPGFRILIATEGTLRLTVANERLDVHAGDTLVVSFNAGPVGIAGSGAAVAIGAPPG